MFVAVEVTDTNTLPVVLWEFHSSNCPYHSVYIPVIFFSPPSIKQKSLYHCGKFWCQARSWTWQPLRSAGTHKWEMLHMSPVGAEDDAPPSVFPLPLQTLLSGEQRFISHGWLFWQRCIHIKERSMRRTEAGQQQWTHSQLQVIHSVLMDPFPVLL